MWNVNKSNRLIWLVVLILFANSPRRAQREVLRKSPQLFTFFLPVSPREAAPAANGAQQRLDSLVRIRDPHAARPLTHLRTVIANTAVLSFTLRRCGASSAARRTLQSKEIAALRPCGRAPPRPSQMLSDMHELLNCSRKVHFIYIYI